MPLTNLDLDVRRARSAVYTLHAHWVFVSTSRRPFTDPMLTCCEHLMHAVCAGVSAGAREFNGETDHLHLLVHYRPAFPCPCWSTG